MSIQNSTLPDGWRWARLGDVCDVVSGSTPRTGVSQNWDGNIVWITPSDLGKLENAYIVDSERLITQQGLESAGLEIIPPGSVVMSSRAPIGHLGIAKVSLCTNQGCKSFVPGSRIDTAYLFFALKKAIPVLKYLGSGSTFTEISKSALQVFTIPLPPLPEQQRIAAILSEQMAAVEEARAAAVAQLEAAQALPAAFLRQVFESEEAQGWERKRLGEVLLLRKEVIHPRDKPRGGAVFVGLQHIESHTGRQLGSNNIEMAELTGRKPKFYEGDIVYGYLRPYLNKVWVATFEGLCSVDQYVYSVLQKIANTHFIAWFMRSATYLQRAPIGTTPGQLPRIRTDEVASVEINMPSLEQQRHIVDMIEENLKTTEKMTAAIEARIDAIDKLPAALLRQAFRGELTQRPGVPVSIQLAPEDVALAVAARSVERLQETPTLGRVKLAKLLYLSEVDAGIEQGRHYVRAPIGPYDKSALLNLEAQAEAAGVFTVYKSVDSDSYVYRPGPHLADAVAALERLSAAQRERLEYLLNLFAQLKAGPAEVIATLYAAWNDFLIDGQQPTDEQIIAEIHDNWTGKREKDRFEAGKLRNRLAWMREHGLIPQGRGPHTVQAE
jgi:type I restriction enzyme S subunit